MTTYKEWTSYNHTEKKTRMEPKQGGIVPQQIKIRDSGERIADMRLKIHDGNALPEQPYHDVRFKVHASSYLDPSGNFHKWIERQTPESAKRILNIKR